MASRPRPGCSPAEFGRSDYWKIIAACAPLGTKPDAVDFCEDAIFEMQISRALSGGEEEVEKVKAAPTIPGEDEPRGIIAPLKENIALGVEQAKVALAALEDKDTDVAADRLQMALEVLGR